MKVYLLTRGDGSDGNEWDLIGVFTTSELAEQAQRIWQRLRKRTDGTTYSFEAAVEEWDVDQPLGEWLP